MPHNSPPSDHSRSIPLWPAEAIATWFCPDLGQICGGVLYMITKAISEIASKGFPMGSRPGWWWCKMYLATMDLFWRTRNNQSGWKHRPCTVGAFCIGPTNNALTFLLRAKIGLQFLHKLFHLQHQLFCALHGSGTDNFWFGVCLDYLGHASKVVLDGVTRSPPKDHHRFPCHA